MIRSGARTTSLAAELRAVTACEPFDLARAALVVAKIEQRCLAPAASLATIRALGDRAACRLHSLEHAPVRQRIHEVNALLYNEARFAGNRANYHDYRNNLLNVVLERRLGIPISLGLVHMEVGRAAGLEVLGVAFPGHFLLRVPGDAGDDGASPIILDPFDGGRELAAHEIRALLVAHAGEDATLSPSLLRPCTGCHFLARLLNNLKRAYVEMRSFPQAWLATDLMLALDPTLLTERRDRGLIAFHLGEYSDALTDLEDYVRLQTWTVDTHDERDRLWEHIRTLRRRAAMRN